MKKLFLILTPIVFLFCLNIGIQAASAVTCNSCEKCTSRSCNEWGETCTPHSRYVCDKQGCKEYGDIKYNCRNVCESGWEKRCKGYAWRCKEWAPRECLYWNKYTGKCAFWAERRCVGGYEKYCTGYENHCALWGYRCDYKYGCIKYGCVSGHTETWEECAPNDTCVGGWSCNSCAFYCSGSDSSCGCKSCANCNAQDNCVGTTYHDYSCSGNSCKVKTTKNSPKCGGCQTADDCTDYSVGQCTMLGGKEGIIGDKRCFEGECQYQHSAICVIECCSDGSNRCCTNCEDKCINVEGRPRSYCSGNDTLKVLDLSRCAGGCGYNTETCGCGCDSSTNPPTCLSSNDIIWGCEDIGEPSERCDGDWFRYSGYHCKGTGAFNISDDFFAKIRKIFSSEAKADEICHYQTSVYCENGCGIQDGKEQCLNNGACPAGCFPDNCGAPACVGCALCVLSCPDRCSGSIYETGGFVANDENTAATCFYANQEWCGNGCCVGPPPSPPSCSWELKECGYGGCPPATHKGRLCVGIGGCVGTCTLGKIECIPDASCGGGPPPRNNPPVAKIDCLDDPSDPPPCKIYTDENITLKGGNSFDTDGFITNYFFNIPSLGRSQNSGNPDFFLGMPAVGIHPVTLIVKDNKGAPSNPAIKNFTVIQALTADFEWEPEFPIRNEEVDFTDLSAGDIVNWSWTFEDGDVPASEKNKQHPQNIKFTSQGLKEITLTLIDSLSNSDTATKYINVKISMPDWKEIHPKQKLENNYYPK